jgi:hypothetical protein
MLTGFFFKIVSCNGLNYRRGHPVTTVVAIISQFLTQPDIQYFRALIGGGGGGREK